MIRSAFLLNFCLCAFWLSAQPITIELSPEPVAEEQNAHGFTCTFGLEGRMARTQRVQYKIRYPDNFEAEDTSFATEYFIGYPGKTPRGLALLIADRKSGAPRIYVDYNNNLNFNDDGPPVVVAKDDSSAVLTFRNKEDSLARFDILYYMPNLEDEGFARLNKMFQRDRWVENGVPMRDSRYWFNTKRLNHRIGYGKIGDDSVKVALYDYNCNGFYDEPHEDHLFVAAPEIPFTGRKVGGTFIYEGDTTLFAFKGSTYRVVSINKYGRSLTIEASDLPFDPPLAPGRPLPDYKFDLLDSTETSLSAYAGEGKYLLIDIWGSWCQGCHHSAPALKELADTHAGQLRILGLNSGEAAERRDGFIEKYKHDWVHGFLTKEIQEGLMVEGFPSYILVDPEGLIVSLQTYPHEVAQLLK